MSCFYTIHYMTVWQANATQVVSESYDKDQKQVRYADCGLFAIANATAIAYSTANFQF